MCKTFSTKRIIAFFYVFWLRLFTYLVVEAWQGYIKKEIGFGHINEARSIYKRWYTMRLSGAGSEVNTQ